MEPSTRYANIGHWACWALGPQVGWPYIPLIQPPSPLSLPLSPRYILHITPQPATQPGITLTTVPGFFARRWFGSYGHGHSIHEKNHCGTQHRTRPQHSPPNKRVSVCTVCCVLPDVHPGQGVLYSTATSTFRAVNCNKNNYGSASRRYGLEAAPCRDCPAGTDTAYGNWADANFAFDSNGNGGFTGPGACAIKAGYGYVGSIIRKCPVGQYNPPGSADACKRCPEGFTTVDNTDQQASVDDCYLAPGYELYNGVARPCPIGETLTWNACSACNAF
jgi:hypothetical protein